MKIFADGAKVSEILELNKEDRISGFTTNPTLMKGAGINDYRSFAYTLLGWIDKTKSVSFEILADEYEEIKKQAKEIASWGDNVYVKIPVMNTKGIYNYNLMNELSVMGIKINATAVMTFTQIDHCADALSTGTPSIISVFAGRIADTGREPSIFIRYAVHKKQENEEILWASVREIYNYKQAASACADIITIPPNLLNTYKNRWAKNLDELSLETVTMFYDDAKESGLKL